MELYLPTGYFHVVQPIRHSVAGLTATLTYGVQSFTAGQEQTDIDNIADAFADAWAAQFDSNTFLDPCTGYYRTVTNGPLAVVISAQAARAGTSAKDSSPPNVAVILKKRTALVGRRFRGRLYLPWVASDTGIDEGGRLLAATITSINTAAAAWLADLNARPNITQMVLLHTPITGDLTPVPDPITSLTVAPVVGTQRRRL